VAGDGSGIGGAKAADAAGEIAAFGVMQSLGRMSAGAAQHASENARTRHRRALAIRPLLDTLYRPRLRCCAPADDTIVCRCEAVTARAIRTAIQEGARDPNHVKAQTRCGMGACLGRQCGTITAQLVAQATGRSVDEVGLFRARPPLRPITLGQLASLAASQT
jgi:bacterioferritin-associated ferredoxin